MTICTQVGQRDSLFSFSFLQMLDVDCTDVTKILPDGASSIVVPKDTEAWQVFTAVSFQGATATLLPGKKYEFPSDMHLKDPVKSFRKAP